MIRILRAIACGAIFSALACGGSDPSEETSAGEGAIHGSKTGAQVPFDRLASRLKPLYGSRLRTDLIKLDGAPSDLNPTVACIRNSGKYVSGTLKQFLWPTEMTKLGDVVVLEALDEALATSNTKDVFFFARNPENENKFELVLTARSVVGALHWESTPRDC